jgi:Peptidase family M28
MTKPELIEAVERLASIERGSASAGEAKAAELLAELMRAHGLEPQLERERSVGGFWRPTGLAAAAGALAGLLGARRRIAPTLLGAAATALMADDVDAGPQLLRRMLPALQTTNVLAWTGDAEAGETIVLVAHHDAAQTGLLFHPGLVEAIDRHFPDWYAKQNTSVQTGRLLSLGPALATLGALLRSRHLSRVGTLWSAVTLALLLDVARSPVVPGANDNLSAVAVLLDIAGRLAERPVKGVRVLLLSTGSEETFMEGMRGFVARHASSLDPAHTRFMVLECVGSPHLMLMEGEGMLRMRDHDAELREEVQAAADAANVKLWRGLRLGAGATDALPALRAGYRTACLAACTDLKTPANYHWATDVPENLSWETIGNAADVCESLIRRVGSGQGGEELAS